MVSFVTQAVIFLSIFIVNVAFAAGAATTGEDHAAILQWVIGGLCTILFSLSAYVLSKVDKNQTKLFERQDDMNERLTRVETKCELNHEH